MSLSSVLGPRQHIRSLLVRMGSGLLNQITSTAYDRLLPSRTENLSYRSAGVLTNGAPCYGRFKVVTYTDTQHLPA